METLFGPEERKMIHHQEHIVRFGEKGQEGQKRRASKVPWAEVIPE
jgi:hypothetical protein